MNVIPPVARPRYSSRPLPPYSYVPGFAPHPVSDGRGHMHGAVAQPVAPLTDGQWQDSEAYRYGIDLFNHGYYWEAHEAWESLWHAAGRRGQVATWLKTLIKLAAAAVKRREGNARGVERHARRAIELLDELAQGGDATARFGGIAVDDVRAIAESFVEERRLGVASPAPALTLDRWLALDI
ncbi:MAG TPA: DUF309 domain-containing protein [Lacipirellula sp.]